METINKRAKLSSKVLLSRNVQIQDNSLQNPEKFSPERVTRFNNLSKRNGRSIGANAEKLSFASWNLLVHLIRIEMKFLN